MLHLSRSLGAVRRFGLLGFGLLGFGLLGFGLLGFGRLGRTPRWPRAFPNYEVRRNGRNHAIKASGVLVRLAASLADSACHRYSRIEHTAGVKESLIHLLLLGAAPRSPDFSLRLKEQPLPAWYRAGLLTAIALLGGIPYVEELWRTLREAGPESSHPGDR